MFDYCFSALNLVFFHILNLLLSTHTKHLKYKPLFINDENLTLILI